MKSTRLYEIFTYNIGTIIKEKDFDDDDDDFKVC